jgi:hypothetical protein
MKQLKKNAPKRCNAGRKLQTFFRLFLCISIFVLCGGGNPDLWGQSYVLYDKAPDSLTVANCEESSLLIYDAYGNTYCLEDVQQPADRLLLSPCDFNADGTLAGGNFSFQVDFFDPAGSGFNDPVFGEQARAVVCQVLRDISYLLVASPDCNGLPPVLRLKIDVSTDDTSTGPFDPLVLGGAVPLYYNFSTPPSRLPGWIHNSVWRTINGGEDPTSYPFVNGTPVYHGMMEFNFHPDVIWNFDMENVAPIPGTHDFYSVVLHEVCHLLGFESLVKTNGKSHIQPLDGYIPPSAGLYTNYDRFLTRNDGVFTPLLSTVTNCYDVTFQGTADILQDGCDMVKFNDPLSPLSPLTLPVFTPNGWLANTEMSHLDDIGGPDGCGPIRFLMNRSVISNSSGESFRRPTDEEIYLLCSLGYQTTGIYGDGTLNFHTVNNEIATPICGAIAAGVDDDGANCHDHFVFCDLPANISIATLVANDIGVLPDINVSCIQPIVGNIAFSASASDITITAADFGWNVLAYIPTDATTGRLANTTFIYFYNGCTPCTITEPCNEVCNPAVNGPCPDTFNNFPFSSSANDMSNCPNLDGWHPCFKSPNYYPASNIASLAFPSNDGCLGLTAQKTITTYTNFLPSEVAVNSVAVQNEQPYIISLHRAVVDNLDCCDVPLDNLKVLLINNDDLICGGSSANMNLAITMPPFAQTVYTETDIPIGFWEQGVACFTANNDYDRMLIYGQQETDNPAYFLLDEVAINKDLFPIDQNITVPCCTTTTIGVEECLNIPVTYSWEKEDAAGNWVDLGINQATHTTDPICAGEQCIKYRVTRYLDNSSADSPTTGDLGCIERTAVYTVCSNCCNNPQDPNIQLACCLLETEFTVEPNTPATQVQIYDGRPAFVVSSDATWTVASNAFTALGFATPGSPISLNVDLVVPSGVTLLINSIDMRFAPNCRILVDNGATLRFAAANIGDVKLSGLCNAVWQGIQVAGPGGYEGTRTASNDGSIHNYGLLSSAGYVTINDAIIGIAAMKLSLMDVNSISLSLQTFPEFNSFNNALFPTVTAALLWDYVVSSTAINSAGAVCQIDKGIQFINCLQGANFSWYVNNPLFTVATPPVQIPSSECFVRGVSVSSTSLKFPFNNIAETPRTEADIQISLYTHLRITGGNGFVVGKDYDNLKYGIRAIAGNDIDIDKVSIVNCGVGISSLGINANAFPLITINESQINDTKIAIQGSASLMSITDNTINDNTSSTPFTQIGIYMRGCDYNIYNNDINRTILGSVLMSSGTNGDQVRLNHFNNTTLPFWAFGNNGNPLSNGTQATCNTFNNYLVAMLTSNYSPTTGPFPEQLGSITDQGFCDEFTNTPADNLFIKGPNPLSSLDIISDATGSSFTYYFRPNTGTEQFDPNIVGNLSKMLCSAPIGLNTNCDGGLLLPDDDIKLLSLGQYADQQAFKKMLYYLQNGDKASAANLLKDLSSKFAQEKTLSYYRDQNNTAEVTTRLAQLATTTTEQVYYKQLQQIYWNMTQDERLFMQLTPTEEALVRQIAQSNTQAAYDAHSLLFLRYGEEYDIPLPPLPDFINDNAVNNFDWSGIYFKTNAAHLPENTIGQVSPNPAQNTAFVPYHIAADKTANLCLYDLYGKLVYTTTLQNSGVAELPTAQQAAGIYILQVTMNGSSIAQQKIVLLK